MDQLTDSEFVFISMGNLTLTRRDAYLNHLKSGIKPDTVAALRTAPLHIPTLFPNSVIKRAEEEIAHFESKEQSSLHSKSRYHPYERREKRSRGWAIRVTDLCGRTLVRNTTRNSRASLPAILRDQPRASSPINDNYCVDKLQEGLLAWSQISTQGQ